jgi:hypothetical protein
MCSCAPLPHPPFKPAPPPNLNPKPNAAPAHGPTPLRRVLVARAAPRDDAPTPAGPSSFDFLALKRELEEQEEAVVAVDAKAGGRDGAVNEEDGEREARRAGRVGGRRTRRQMARRSGLLAKQVISVSSARSLGFVSQLWVDAASVRASSSPPCTCFRLAKLYLLWPWSVHEWRYRFTVYILLFVSAFRISGTIYYRGAMPYCVIVLSIMTTARHILYCFVWSKS